MLIVMGAVVAINISSGGALDDLGVHPRNAEWIWTILTAPLVHAGVMHFVDNAVPLGFLGLFIAIQGTADFVVVTLIVVVIGGLGVWLTAPGGETTVGASGLVLGYASFLVARGIFYRSFAQFSLAAVVCALWGTQFLRSFVPHAGISWQAHLFGAIGGLVAAWRLRERNTRRRVLPLRVRPAVRTRPSEAMASPLAVALSRRDIHDLRDAAQAAIPRTDTVSAVQSPRFGPQAES
jgi:membrane associated rhomboid family serine protease